jgi:hypothetical protein
METETKHAPLQACSDRFLGRRRTWLPAMPLLLPSDCSCAANSVAMRPHRLASLASILASSCLGRPYYAVIGECCGDSRRMIQPTLAKLLC